ncbi:MAG: hypothetical protein MZU84_07560 [Sphingobacterium sp.]|nr:hypothetical protein [Sphingobacterium sp.]
MRRSKIIKGLDLIKGSNIIFHAGTKWEDQKVLSSGGRVLAVNSLANTLDEALLKSYSSAALVSFDKMFYRKDLGKDLKKLFNLI